VVDDDRIVDVAAEGRDGIERQGRPGCGFTGRRRNDDEPAELDGRLARRRPEVAQERAGNPEEEHVEEDEEEDPDDPERDREAVHQPASATPDELGPTGSIGATDSTTRIVSPIRIWSPSPRAISSIRRSLTQEPFVLPRSVRTRAPRRPYSRAWWREARLSARTRPLSGARPIVSGRPPTTSDRDEPSGRISRRTAWDDSIVGTTKTAVCSIGGGWWRSTCPGAGSAGAWSGTAARSGARRCVRRTAPRRPGESAWSFAI